MSDDSTTPHSGSRWEPRTDAGAPTPAPVPPPEAQRTASPLAGPDSVAPWGRRSWVSRRGGLAAGALALVLAAGAGGFAVSEVAQHPGGGTPFGVSSQPQDAGFPAPPPGYGDDDGPGDDGGQLGGQLGGQVGGGESDDGGSQPGASL